MERLKDLVSYLRGLGAVTIAYSAGIDSTVLLKAALEALGPSNLLAATFSHPGLPACDLKEAEAFCKREGIEWLPVEVNPLEQEVIRSNPKDRCYHCKRYLFQTLIEEAHKRGFTTLCDGTNFDDLQQFRPGLRALQALGVLSPLARFHFTKAEVRALAVQMNLPNAQKPSAACLMTRFPYGTTITPEGLSRVGQGEAFLRTLVDGPLRLRDHCPIARIEVAPPYMEALFKKRDEIAAALKALGYNYVTLDLEGFRSGSMDEPTIVQSPLTEKPGAQEAVNGTMSLIKEER